MAVTISLMTEDDIKTLYPLGNDRDVSWMSGGGLTYPISYADFRLRKTIAVSTDRIDAAAWAIRWNDTLVGSIGYFRRQPDAGLEIGYWLGKNYWGKGIATAALELTLDAMRAGGLSGPLTASTTVDNAGSRRILEKCGFRKTGSEVYESPARKMEVEGIIHSIDL